MPAQRRVKKVLRLQKKRPKFKVLIYLIILIGLTFGTIIFFNRAFWNGKDKLTIVSRDLEDNVVITTYDPQVGEIISITVPSQTEVEVAKNFGVWKIGSVWQLGYQEKEKGALLAKTVTRHLKFPSFVWADRQSLGFNSSGISGLFKATFSKYDSNLKLGDKIGLALFSLGVENSKRADLKLEETGYLKKTTLSDGSKGYRVEGSIPQRIAILFTNTKMSNGVYRIIIKDRTGRPGLTEELNLVLEVLGGKVLSITREDEADFNCEIRSDDKEVGDLIRNLFNCRVAPVDPGGNFDMEIVLGKKFADEF